MNIEDKKLESQYNEARNQTERISYLWMIINNHKIDGNLHKWNDALGVVFDELVASLCKIKGYDFNKWIQSKEYLEMVQRDKKIALLMKFGKRKGAYSLIRQKENSIKIMQEELGKGGKYSDPEDEGF